MVRRSCAVLCWLLSVKFDICWIISAFYIRFSSDFFEEIESLDLGPRRQRPGMKNATDQAIPSFD